MAQTDNGFQEEVLARLRAIRTSGGEKDKQPEKIPLIDPTANVRALFDMERSHQTDLRAADTKRLDDLQSMKAECDKEKDQLKEQLREAESKRIDAVNLAERSRIDANVAQGKADVALASEKAAATAITLANSVVASAKALSDTVANTTTIQDKRLTALEQRRYEDIGDTQARTASRQQYQWLIGLIVVLAVAAIVHFWK